MNSLQDTIAAIATPIGEGGLGVIRVSGASAIGTVEKFFNASIHLNEAASHTCHYGKIRTEEELLDQAVVTLFRAPNSYTGEDVVEISAHGSPFILQKILRLCLRGGARLAEPGEFTERAFLHGKLDLTQAEAVAELIRAKTEKSHAAALSQLEGHLSRRVRGLRERLIPLLAHIEVGLDHSDEDHDFLRRESLVQQCAAVREEIARILRSAATSKILREGFRVVLLGRPNVGKSSLLNALLKEDRAIVTPIAGTTRDTLEEAVRWDGLPVILTDTAGIHKRTDDPIEEFGMQRTHRAIAAADMVLVIHDGSESLTDDDECILKMCEGKSHVRVFNKSDLTVLLTTSSPAATGGGPIFKRSTANGTMMGSPPATAGNDGVCKVSAKTGEGLVELIEAVKKIALGVDYSGIKAEWLLNVRHQNALSRAQEALTQAEHAARDTAFEECIALEIKTALDALGEIIGETTTEDLLDQIFSTFCVGK
jgi:tRNA modification GTPase